MGKRILALCGFLFTFVGFEFVGDQFVPARLGTEAKAESTNFTITCQSVNFGYQECNVRRVIRDARLLVQHSTVMPDGRGRCVEGETWGFFDTIIWVDYGCRADFTFYPNHDSDPLPPPSEPTPGPTPEPPTSPAPPSEGANLVCAANNNGSYQPYDVDRQRLVGRNGFGYRFSNECQAAVDITRRATYPIVCNWNGYSFQPYFVPENLAIGKLNHGFALPYECNQNVLSSQNGLICNFSGGGWTPYQIHNGRPAAKSVGQTHYGFNALNACQDEIRSFKDGLLCSWNGYSWQPFFVPNETVVGEFNYGFGNIFDCRRTVQMSNRGVVCSWNGRGFRPYRARTNEPIGHVAYTTLRDCYSSVH